MPLRDGNVENNIAEMTVDYWVWWQHTEGFFLFKAEVIDVQSPILWSENDLKRKPSENQSKSFMHPGAFVGLLCRRKPSTRPAFSTAKTWSLRLYWMLCVCFCDSNMCLWAVWKYRKRLNTTNPSAFDCEFIFKRILSSSVGISYSRAGKCGMIAELHIIELLQWLDRCPSLIKPAFASWFRNGKA